MMILDDKLEILIEKLKKKWKIISIITICCTILVGGGLITYNHMDISPTKKERVATVSKPLDKSAKINLQIELNNSSQSTNTTTNTKKYCIDALIGLITSTVGYILKKLIDTLFESKKNMLINVFRDLSDEDAKD
jgi:hypothetical protein